MGFNDADPLLALHGLTAVIRTGQEAVTAFIASSSYSEAGTSQEEKPSKRSKSSAVDDGDSYVLEGSWTVSVGCDQAWWGVTLRGAPLETILRRYTASSDLEAVLKRENIDVFAAHAVKAWNEAMLGWSASPANAPVREWTTISLYIGVQSDAKVKPIKLRLGRLDPEKAMKLSTALLLTTDPTRSLSADHRMFRQEIAHLQKGLDAAQQALREERHKYRTMLTNSPSGRAKIMYPSSPSRKLRPSQSSTSLLSSSPSHRSSPLKAPSSDDHTSSTDEPTVTTSQRSTSLVNPARAFRAPPTQNEDFVGDSDSD